MHDEVSAADWQGEPAACPGDDAKSIAAAIRRHRDWRIDVEDPKLSVVFTSSGSPGGQLAPVSGNSPFGRELLPCFYAIAKEIESHRRRALADQYRQASGAGVEPRSFAVVVDGVRCRVQRILDTRFHVRVAGSLLPFERLGLPASIRQRLLSPQLDAGGLVVVCGSYGSGKTSTVNAVVRARIELRGGYALVMGHPLEYEYAGFHGSSRQPGYVEQVDLVGLDIGAEIRASMRNFPSGATSILAYPELIGPEGSGEMLRAANRGNLVFADMHALNIDASLLNLVSMGEQDGEAYSRELLGNALQMVIHQTMSTLPPAADGRARGVVVNYTAVTITKSMRAAIVDKTLPLSRALLGLVDKPG